MAQQSDTFRAQNQIQRNKLLVGVLQLSDTDGFPDVLLDADHLADMMPPKSQVLVFDIDTREEAQLNGFLCACDVLISPPHPCVIDYLTTGKPFLPLLSHIVPVGDSWKEAAGAYQTHDAIAKAVQKIADNGMLDTRLTINAESRDVTTKDFSDVLVDLLQKKERT